MLCVRLETSEWYFSRNGRDRGRWNEIWKLVECPYWTRQQQQQHKTAWTQRTPPQQKHKARSCTALGGGLANRSLLCGMKKLKTEKLSQTEKTEKFFKNWKTFAKTEKNLQKLKNFCKNRKNCKSFPKTEKIEKAKNAKLENEKSKGYARKK